MSCDPGLQTGEECQRSVGLQRVFFFHSQFLVHSEQYEEIFYLFLHLFSTHVFLLLVFDWFSSPIQCGECNVKFENTFK